MERTYLLFMSNAPEFNEFTAQDWMTYAGCEDFADGGSPLIASLKIDGDDAVAILDKEGLTIDLVTTDEAGHEDTFVVYYDHAKGLAARKLASLRLEMTISDFSDGQVVS